MPLPAPNLDDRTFQDLVREARSMIPRYCPEWTDHNLSDPGVTLIELFAWMTETLLYRLNKVPEKNYIKFMELLGITLAPPRPAQVDLTFRLSAPQPRPVTIPAGTEAATVRTDTQEAIVFTTDRDLVISSPTLVFAFVSPDGIRFDDCLPALRNPDQLVTVFEPVPKEGNALYLGYTPNLKSQALTLNVTCRSEGIGIDPRDPPWAWEFWESAAGRWVPLRLEKDTTGGFNTTGQILLHIPDTAEITELNAQRAFWVRCRAIKARPAQRAYAASPKIAAIESACMGGTVPASHARIIRSEFLGRSNGQPGQRFFLRSTPVLARMEGETIEVENAEGRFEPWQEVPDFAASGPDVPHFVCDGVSGEIAFGPRIRQPSGEERQYGRIPPMGKQIRFTRYRSGGGVIGNVGEKTIKVLKSSIPYVSSVINFQPARGGADVETIEAAKMRAPRTVRAITRAVTAEDFEHLAREASSLVARAKCIGPGEPGGSSTPGGVRVISVPVIPTTDEPIPETEIPVPPSVQEQVKAYLDERRLLGTRLEIGAPQYVPLIVQAKVRAMPFTDPEKVRADIERRLYRYLHPVCGGPDGKGWPFGHAVSQAEVFSAIQGTRGVGYVEEAKVIPVDPATGRRQAPTVRLEIPPDGLPRAFAHEITVV